MNSQSTTRQSSISRLSSLPLVLIVEDDDSDYQVIQHSFQQSPIANQIIRCHTGKQALDYLQRAMREPSDAKQIPSLILLDLNLPEIAGRQVLKTIKQDPFLHFIPIVMLTASDRLEDIKECYCLGAGGYVLKASDLQQFKESIAVISEFWLNRVILPELHSLMAVSSHRR